MSLGRVGPRRRLAAASLLTLAVGLAGCGGGGGGGGPEPIELTFLVDQGDVINAQATALIDAFQAQNPGIEISLDTRPGGAEGENLVKTRLATGEMPDLFTYNSGSLLQAINPQQNLLPLTGEAYLENVDPEFLQVVTAGADQFGVPFGTITGGGVLYNKAVYARLGLTVPKSWDQFMSNNQRIRDAGLVAVIQTYKDTPSAQMFVLTDYFNVQAAVPDFSEKYTKNQAHFADTPAALAGFQRQEQLFRAGYFNEDFGSATFDDGLAMLAEGAGAHYPTLSGALATLQSSYPESVQDIGFFPMPGSDPARNGMTVWYPSGIYVPKTAEHPAEAKRFLAFVASTAGCEAMASAGGITGPYLVDGCTLPPDVPPVVSDVNTYVQTPGATAPALEFVSPIKGPALPQITVEVGSGIRPAVEGAALYDQDVRKQAQQLGLPGW